MIINGIRRERCRMCHCLTIELGKGVVERGCEDHAKWKERLVRENGVKMLGYRNGLSDALPVEIEERLLRGKYRRQRLRRRRMEVTNMADIAVDL